jgi:pimeloyl-ACP methyl ester carboxylesterase
MISTRTGRTLEVREYGDPRGQPLFFFHGLIGSHYQASYIAERARSHGLRIIAPNRPGVGRSEFVERRTAVEVVPDVEDMARALGLDRFGLIGISGGTPYALACLHRLGERIRSIAILSGMGPVDLPGGLRGMDRRRWIALELGSRYPGLARREAARWGERFRADPRGFLQTLVSTWCQPDRDLFRRDDIFDLFLCDLHQVFSEGRGSETFAQDLWLYRHNGFSLDSLPREPRVVLWHGLQDTIVPPAMCWAMAQRLPSCEAHLVPGGHFVAATIAEEIIRRLREQLDGSIETP